MEAFTSFLDSQSSSRNRWNSDTLMNFSQIPPFVQNHIKKVYLALCFAVVAAAAGAYMHVHWIIGGLLTIVASRRSNVLLRSIPIAEEKKRVALLMASSFFHGASIVPLIDLAIEVDPSLTFAAFVGTLLAFASFFATAFVTRRREYLYLGGLLSSGMSILTWLHFASSIFGGAAASFKFELYFGLLAFVGYIVFDAQNIIERAYLRDLDYVERALTFVTDIDFLMIVLKDAAEKNEKKKKRRD